MKNILQQMSCNELLLLRVEQRSFGIEPENFTSSDINYSISQAKIFEIEDKKNEKQEVLPKNNESYF